MTDEPDILSRPFAPPEHVLRYASRPDAVVDLHVPLGLDRTRGHPLVVLVHGGFWRQRYDRAHLGPMARDLVAQGYLVAVVEYRRVGGGGGWPTTAVDVETAVLALPRLLGAHGLRASTTTLVGHSAGGHLVLWLAAREHVPAEKVVALAPVTDLRTAVRDGVGDGAVQALLGGGPAEVPERYAEADPFVVFGEVAVPRHVVLLHGTADDVVPVSQSRDFVLRHRAVPLLELERLGHYELIDPRSEAWPWLLAALADDA